MGKEYTGRGGRKEPQGTTNEEEPAKNTGKD